jgi:3-deoxy-7-phosphoheptulonate synthase
LPIIADPSHASGQRRKVLPLARAAIAVGADGLMIEVHDHPDRALSDGVQSILPDEFAQLRDECAQIAQVLARKLN